MSCAERGGRPPRETYTPGPTARAASGPPRFVSPAVRAASRLRGLARDVTRQAARLNLAAQRDPGDPDAAELAREAEKRRVRLLEKIDELYREFTPPAGDAAR